VAGVQSGVGPVLQALPSRAVPEGWLRQFTPKALGRVKLGVRLLKKEAPRGAPSLLRAPRPARPAELPMLVEFSHPPAPSADQIEVPDTYRLLLEVSWGEGAGRRLRQLSLYPNETQLVEVGYGEVKIRTAVGDTHALRTRFEYDFLLLYNRADADFASQLSERLASQDYGRGKKLVFLAEGFAYGSGVPDFLPLESTFSLSRRVGFVASANSAYDLNALEARWRARPEPPHLRDWLIPIRVGPGAARDFPGSAPVADFRANFEEGFRSLWKTLTGENLPLPKPEPPPAVEPINVFYAYSHKDEALRDQLEKHLSLLRRMSVIKGWHERRVLPGGAWGHEIDEHVETADLILFLISADFLASDYSYGDEVKRAIERHETGEARVVPVILRPCDWERTPFSDLQALPKGARPVMRWRSRDEALTNIAEGIRQIAEELQAKKAGGPRRGEVVAPTRLRQVPRPPIVGFVARHDSGGRDLVARLREELAPERGQLVALWGAGGVGKTTLAAEAARSLADAFGQRVVWTSAAGRADYSLSSLLDDAATQLGLDELRRLAPDHKAAQVRDALAKAPALVVLDNFETIRPDEEGRCLDFLHQTPCSVLITSRARIAQARSIIVTAMSPEEAQDFLDRLINLTSEPRVFTSTVRRRIVEAAEANPLLMQWVVGQIDAAQEPETVLRQLAAGEGDAAERVFGMAFQLPQLTDDGRTALLALSLFEPSASRPALAFVAGFGDDEKRLNEAVRRLADLWLVKTTAEGKRLTVEGLTREMARAMLAKDVRADEYRRRFVEHFLSYAESYREPTPEALDALETEKDNLLGAAGAAYASADWEGVMRLASAVTGADGFLSLRGYWDDAERVCRQALEAARMTKRSNEEMLFAANLAGLLHARGQTDEAELLLKEALGIARRFKDVRAEASITLQLAYVGETKGDLENARRLYHESLEHYERIGDPRGRAGVLNRLGYLATAQGAYHEAEKFLRDSLAISRKEGDIVSLSLSLNNLGQLAQEQGKLMEAESFYHESLEIQRRLGNQSGIADNLSRMGSLKAATDSFAEAQPLLEESLTIFRRLGRQEGVARVLRALGKLSHDKPAEARRLYSESLEITRRLGDRRGIAETLLDLGRLSEEEGDKAAAAQLFGEALPIFETFNSVAAERARKHLVRLFRS